MRKIFAATLLSGSLALVPAFDAVQAQSDTATEADDDDDNGNIGLIGLAGLLGLAGLAGLRRRDTRYDTTRVGADRRVDIDTMP